jgi:chlorobactene glucosyltransferase
VLVPARDEAKNIGLILSGITQQTYSNMEIVVYDDQSTDETVSIVQRFMREEPRLRLISGTEKPNGWMGKNYACHCLAQAAKGDFFLFLDADVDVTPAFVENALAYMQRKRLTLLSMFPRQELVSFGEKLVVPSMNWILLSMLFLRLIHWSRRRSLAAANGQMMMFEAQQYRLNLWHQQVMGTPVEDIAISRLIKRKRLRMSTLLGTNDISCRMYGSYSEAINGFTKNVKGFFGGSIVATILFALFETFAPIVVIFGLPFPLTFLFFFAWISSRMLVARLSEQSVLFNVLQWPLQQAAFLHLVYRATNYTITKKLTWKGRNV